MMQSWANAGDALATQAAIDFPAEKYERRDGVCEFKEHVAQNADGSSSHYSRDELAAMVRNMNNRVAETGNYGGLIDGHTSDVPGAADPDVLGFRGPYYLGQIGNSTPRWAIFSTEHHKREMLPRLKAKPTRSAEVWRSPRIEDRILDPVAALGAETPRLDLGMVRYQRTGTMEIDGQQIERYAAASMPGAASVAIPTDKYAEPEGADMGLSPEDVQQIAGKCAEAIMDSPEWQFLQSIMSSGDGESDADIAAPDAAEGMPDDGGAPEPAPEPGPESVDEYADPAPDPMADPMADPAPDPMADPMADPAPDPMADPMAGPAPEPMADPMAGPAPEPMAPVASGAPADGPVENRVAELEAEVAALKAQLQPAQAEQYRRKALEDLHAKGFQINVADQLEIVEEMADEQFEKYSRGLQRSVARVPLADSPDVHDPPIELPKRTPSTGSEPEMERYSRKAVQHCQEHAVSFASALELAIAGKI